MEKIGIVYNACHGGFGLSDAAVARLKEFGVSVNGHGWNIGANGMSGDPDNDLKRHDQRLVQVVQELGRAANTRFSSLKIRWVERGTKYRIDEYDGMEDIVLADEQEWLVADAPTETPPTGDSATK